MPKPNLSIFASLYLFAAIPCMQAASMAVLFNDFNSGSTVPDSISTYGGWGIQGATYGPPGQNKGSVVAARFVPTVTAQLAEIDVALGITSYDSHVTFELFTDNNGSPGSQIGSSLWNTIAPATSGTVTKIAASNIYLYSGTAYWLVAIPGQTNTVVNWLDNSSYQDSYAFGYLSNTPGATPSWYQQNNPPYGGTPYFAIQGIAGVPEPSGTGLILMSAAVFIGLAKLRRSALRRACLRAPLG